MLLLSRQVYQVDESVDCVGGAFDGDMSSGEEKDSVLSVAVRKEKKRKEEERKELLDSWRERVICCCTQEGRKEEERKRKEARKERVCFVRHREDEVSVFTKVSE